MDSSHSSFYFMGMTLILRIAAIIIQYSQRYLSETLSEAQQGQEFIIQENSFQKQQPIRSQSQWEIPTFLKKPLKYLLYFTFSYYLCQFITGSFDLSRSIFVRATTTPIQEHDVFFNVEQNHFHQRILEEEEGFQQNQLSSPKVKGEPQDDPLDRLPMITKTQGAISVVVSKDGNKIFQVSEIFTPYNTEYVLSGMDITDPLSIKYYPPLEKRFTRPDITLVLSSDSKTLFVVSWGEFHIYNISHIHSAPKYVSSARIPRNDSSTKLKPAAVLYEEKNLLIIANNNFHIFNISDYNQPVHEFWYPIIWMKPQAIALLPEREIVLLGSQEGLKAFDISDPKKPVMKKRILENEFVFSISLTVTNQLLSLVS